MSNNDGIFGKWAFPQDRIDAADLPSTASDEKNTSEEDIALIELIDHVKDNKDLSDAAISIIKSAMVSGKYADILKAPRFGANLYRGIAVSDEWLDELLGKSRAKSGKVQKVNASDIVYKSPSGGNTSSWSASQAVSTDFALRNNAGDKKNLIMLVAMAGMNMGTFLVGMDGFYKLTKIKNYNDEEEILALGPVKVFSMEWKSISIT